MLPQDTGAKIEFNMLPFNMFDSTPVLGYGNHFEPHKSYRAPRAQSQKKRRKKRGFFLLVQIFKKIGNMEDT